MGQAVATVNGVLEIVGYFLGGGGFGGGAVGLLSEVGFAGF